MKITIGLNQSIFLGDN